MSNKESAALGFFSDLRSFKRDFGESFLGNIAMN